ncbi:hypothetical protein H6P81_006028 [Aristolochia fimbriata]|uniref:Aminotransferase-like plant mobile domain-containing protein n=1 Tax=Aristolochia fimbriata TaxID=158543 RepID=A0AAV7EXC2_ARIFI|nr:hypothetical protein H6P81_006028 [Aristolochia fimbriata]
MVLRWLVIWPPGPLLLWPVLPWPAFTKVWDTLAAGWPSMAQWPYLYTWLAVYFHTHGEDLEVSRRPGMISFGDPSLKRNFTEDQACDLFQRLPVPVWHRYVLATAKTSFLVDERKKPIARQHYESLLSVRSCFLTVRRSIHFFVEPYCPARFARQFGYCQDLPGDMGITANHREISSLSELVALWKTSIVRPCGRLDLPPSGERDPSRDPGTTPAYYTWWTTHMSSLFQAKQEEGSSYHFGGRFWFSSQKKKKARKEVPPASFPLSHRTFLPPIPETEPPTSCPSENPPIETVQILSSPEAPVAPQEEASVVGELAEITPSEGLPVQEVAPSPSVVQEEAVIEAEALPPRKEEEDPTPAVEVPAIEAAVGVIQEEAWRDRIVPRMLSPGVVSDISLLADAGFAISRDEAEGIARNTLAVVSSKLEEAKATLGEVVEELSEAKAEEEDARERFELAREQLQSAGTKVAYLTTQAEQIQESVRGLKTDSRGHCHAHP